ncbi:transcriptional regulator, TetR family [Sporobacter termitidis DSM 10068]|uniref:Transcriptional regulator, TetR family n=1 Tax=Sporobacter termitidis DSM 10068 TaxID=1123282 RepID=A0A1M5Z955_9FIRM|nr:TetR/AcrR family transcriptional regulator [Sporobacter termitidis]SHI20648.1 transcriptional regulator, TetR family [Sporobacter termitidis DSM 10068]
MDENTPDAKERIMNTVVGLMLEGKDLTRITNREIASLAGVNSALINYYYQSKENLLNLAVGACMSQMADQLLEDTPGGAAPRQRLRNMMRGISRFAVEHRFLSEISISAELKGGNENTVRTILPILKEIFKEKSENELRLLALQLIVPLQVILLHPTAYKKSLNGDVSDLDVGFRLLDIFIDNIIGQAR